MIRILGLLLTIAGILAVTVLGPPLTSRAEASAELSPITTESILSTAGNLLGIRYVWGGVTTSGLDCSSYLSRAWAVPRQTTDTLSSVAHPIAKADLQPGDALNLPTWEDPRHRGHVRLFAGWVDSSQDWMWVYEEKRPRSVYHAIPYDDRYTPMRRNDYQPTGASDLVPPLLPLIPTNIADPRLANSIWS